MSVLILDNKRIFLDGIRNYELGSDKLYYRNDKEVESFFFIPLTKEDELWSECSFKYLYIKMFNGKSYKFFSDKKLHDLMEEMGNYFEEADIDVENYNDSEYIEGVLEEDEHLRKAVKSYVRIRKKFIFVKQDISDIANRLDNAFGTI